jgi:hypothetical protein
MSKRMMSDKSTLLLAVTVVLAISACKKTSSTTGATSGGAAVSGSAGTSVTGTAGSTSGSSGTGTVGSAGASSGAAGTSVNGSAGTTSGSAGTSPAGSAGGGATCPQCVDMPFSFGFTGGLVAYTDLSAFAPCGHYAHTRTPASSSGGKPMSCANDAPCSGDKTITPGMVKDAIANADVQKALNGTMLFGVDTTPTDAPIYQFRVGYNTVQVGAPCSGQADCKPTPAGVQALVDLLKALDMQQLALAPCPTAIPQK